MYENIMVVHLVPEKYHTYLYINKAKGLSVCVRVRAYGET